MAAARGHHFLADSLGPQSVVLDLGAHLGEFSSELNQRFGCQCYAVEALASLYGQIPESPKILKFNYAIGAQDGPVDFFIADNIEGNSIRNLTGQSKKSIQIPGITLEKFLAKNSLAIIDLLKLDIEGAEIDVIDSLKDATLKNFKQITIEFHDFVNVVSSDEVNAVKRRLKLLGFYCIVFTWRHHADVLFINQSGGLLTSFKFLYYKLIWKYLDGLSRILHRWMNATQSQ
jgi:FkbM family methyltransferase